MIDAFSTALGTALTAFVADVTAGIGDNLVVVLPVVLGVVLAILGGIITIGAVFNPGPKVADFPLRPVIILTAGVVLFGLTLKLIGLFPGLVMLTVVSGIAGTEFKPVFSLVLGVIIAAVSSVLFVQLLGLNLPIFGSLFQF